MTLSKKKLHNIDILFNFLQIFSSSLIGLYHPLDATTNPKYKLSRFLTTAIFLQRVEGPSF
jgi:hypothetical protein